MDMDMNGHYDHHPKQPKQKRRNKIKSILIMITSLFIKENAKNVKNAANLTYQHFLHPVNSGCFSYYGVSPAIFTQNPVILSQYIKRLYYFLPFSPN